MIKGGIENLWFNPCLEPPNIITIVFVMASLLSVWQVVGVVYCLTSYFLSFVLTLESRRHYFTNRLALMQSSISTEFSPWFPRLPCWLCITQATLHSPLLPSGGHMVYPFLYLVSSKIAFKSGASSINRINTLQLMIYFLNANFNCNVRNKTHSKITLELLHF